LVFLASRSGLPIVPVGVAYTRAWRLRSWDRFAIPHPWSVATCVFGLAVSVPAGLDRPGLERYRRLIQQEMEAITAGAEHWAETGEKPGQRSQAARKAG